MKKSILKLKDITLKDDLYPRERVNEKTVREYVKAMNNGDVFPPLYVANFKGKNLLVDGRHRLEAYEELGEKYVQCEIKTNFPTYEDIFVAAVRANLKHGQRLTETDKWKIVTLMKKMEYSAEGIAQLVGIEIGKIESGIVGEIRHQFIKKGVKEGTLPTKVTDTQRRSETLKLVDEQEIKRLEEASQEEWQLDELKAFYYYIKKTKFYLDNKKVLTLIKKIKKVVKVKFKGL